MYALIVTGLNFVAVVILSVLFFGQSIGMIAYLIGLLLTTVLWVNLIIIKGGNILSDQYDFSDEIDLHLSAQGFSSTSRIKVYSNISSSVNKPNLPCLIISTDVNSRRLAFTKYEKNQFLTVFLEFQKIKGGKILINKDTETIDATHNVASEYLDIYDYETVVRSIEYRFAIDDALNPDYTVKIFEGEVYESAPIYSHYRKVASNLDVLVKSILEENKADI